MNRRTLDNNSTHTEELISLPTLPMGTFYSAVAVDLQHSGIFGNDTKPSTHYPKSIQIPKSKYDALIALFSKHKIKEGLRPVLLMSFASICKFVTTSANYKWFESTSKELLSNVFKLITFLEEIEKNEKKLCKAHFTYHVMKDGNMSDEKLSFTVKGHFACEFLQSILSSHEKAFGASAMNNVYKNLYDSHKSGLLTKIPSPLAPIRNKKREKYYALHLLYFLLMYQVKGADVKNSNISPLWPALTPVEKKKYPIRQFHLFVGRFMELAGLIRSKDKYGYYADTDLIDVIRKIWDNRGSSPRIHDMPTLLVPPPKQK